MKTTKNLSNDFKRLRMSQLTRALDRPLRDLQRPSKGWIRTVRQAMGVSSGEMARRLKTSRQLPLQQEKNEAEDRITLKSLRAAAAALDCDLVYGFVPRGKGTTFEQLKDLRARAAAQTEALAVQISMSLEDQALSPDSLARVLEHTDSIKENGK